MEKGLVRLTIGSHVHSRLFGRQEHGEDEVNDGRPDRNSVQQWIEGESEGRWATRRQGGERGTDERDGTRTGVSEWYIVIFLVHIRGRKLFR